jgi:hypothetical protein
VRLKLSSVRNGYAFEIEKRKAMRLCSYDAVDIAAESMSKIRRWSRLNGDGFRVSGLDVW